VLVLDKNTFQTEVLERQGFVLVDYWSDGCEPCKALMPSVEELAGKYEGKVIFAKLNTMKARRLAISQKVLGLPVIILYKDGQKIDELIKDNATKVNIDTMLQSYVG